MVIEEKYKLSKQTMHTPPPFTDDVDPVQKQPSSVVSARNGDGESIGQQTSWKLVSSVPQEQQQFVIKIRKQTD